MAKLAFSASVALCVAAGCESENAERPALDASGSSFVVEADPASGAAVFALAENGGVPLPAAATPEVAVLAFMDRYRVVLGMRAPSAEWRHVETSKDLSGESTIRYTEIRAGIDVYGAEWLVRLNEKGELASMAGHYVSGLDGVATTPTLASAEATARARVDLLAVRPDLPPDATVETTIAGAPVFYVGVGAKPALAFVVTVGTPDGDGLAFVDAHDGKILGRRSSVRSYGNGYGSRHYRDLPDSPLLSFPVSAGSPRNLDGLTSHGVHLQTYSRKDSVGGRLPASPVTEDALSSADAWHDRYEPRGVTVDVQANLAGVLDAFHDVYGRRSYDDRGSPVRAWINAETDMGAQFIRAGTGCPDHGAFQFSDGSADTPTWAAFVELVAHEFTHAVSACTWNASSDENEDTNAIDEGVSDVMGVQIRAALGGGRDTKMTPFGGAYTRDLGAPHQVAPSNPGWSVATGPLCDSVSDSCGDDPHFRSGIVSYAWHLMTNGGTHETNGLGIECPLGWSLSGRVWERAITKLIPASPRFRDVALATIAAGRELHAEMKPIVCAWVATEVLSAKDATTWKVTCPEPGKKDESESVNLTPCSGTTLVQ